MALPLPSNLYKGNAVEVDAMPYVRYIDARKKAKDAAANQYFTKLTEKINTAGVRQQDLMSEHGGILNDIEEWKREAMTKGRDMMGQQNLNFKFQKLLNKIEQSKSRAKQELEIGKAKFEGKYDPTDDDLNVLDKMGKSIYDPQSYKEDGVSEYGWEDISAAVPEFDPSKQNTFFNAAIGKNKPDYDEAKARVDNVTGKVYVPQRYSGETIKNIADNAGNIFEGSREAKKHYGKLLYDKSFLIPANEEFKAVYGRDIQTAKELAMADAIIRAKNVDSEVAVTDVNYAQKLKKEMERIRDANIRGRAKTGSGSNSEINDLWGAINSQVDNDVAKFGKAAGTRVNSLGTDAAALIMKTAKESTGNNDIESSDIFIHKDGEDIKIYKVSDGGKLIISKETEVGVVPKVGTNLKVQADVKGKRAVVAEGNTQKTGSYLIKGKKYTEKELLDMGYTTDQIQPYKQN